GEKELTLLKDLAVTSVGDTSVTLGWGAVDGVTGYQLQRTENGQWIDCGTVAQPNAVISGLSSCKEYKFRVRAYIQNGAQIQSGAFSNEVSATTMPSQVSGVTASSGNTTVTLKWNSIPSASGYSIYIYKASTKKYKYYKDASGGATSSIKLTGLKPNTQYKFKVLAYNTVNGAKIKGLRSSAVTVKTKNNVVTLNSAKSSKSKRITVKWAKISGISGYEVMWSTSSKFKSNFLSVKVGSPKASTTLKTSQSKKSYYVRVRAYKKTKSKTTYYPWSKTIKVKVK
ncbi:MAG: fibronectin type III domain-containing protein, partial [Eubacterium sp.]